MRIKKNINLGIISWSNTKFFELTFKNCTAGSKENYKFDLGIKVFPEIVLTLSGFLIKILLHKCEK